MPRIWQSNSADREAHTTRLNHDWWVKKAKKISTGFLNSFFFLQIWTSELRRTISTVQNIPGPRAALKDLNEINAGICEGLTYEEIQERFPSEFAWRDQDKLKYRYPHGESYLDLLQRVDGVVQALLLNTDVLVVSHQAVLRCIMAYFKGSKPGKLVEVFASTENSFRWLNSRGNSIHQLPTPHHVGGEIVRLRFWDWNCAIERWEFIFRLCKNISGLDIRIANFGRWILVIRK